MGQALAINLIRPGVPRLRQAGFVSVQWHPPVVSPAGVQQYGQDYGQHFLELTPIIGIECRR